MVNYKYIYDSKEFEKYKRHISSCFKINNKLPNQVFQNNYKKFVFEDFDRIMTGDGWDSIKKIAKASNEKEIIFSVIDPIPDKYYYRHFGYYNWFIMSIEATAEEYTAALEIAPNGDIADAIYYNSFIIAIVPLSKKWAIWGDRNYGICILGVDEEYINNSFITTISEWKNINKIGSWMEFYLYRNKDKENIYKLFKKNY